MPLVKKEIDQRALSLRVILRNQLHIRAGLTRQGWLGYWTDLSRIRQFGQSRGVLATSFWFFNLRLTSMTATFFRNELQLGLLPKVRAMLKLALTKGWLHLDKTRYNLLAIAARLVDELIRVEYRIDKAHPLHEEPAWEAAEAYFLVLHSDPSYLDQCLTALDLVYGKLDPDDQAHFGKPRLLAELVNLGGNLPSVGHLFVAANMVRFRRHLELVELINPGHGPLVSHDTLDCTTEVAAEIKRYVAALAAELDPLCRDLGEIRRLREFMPNLGDKDGPLDPNYAVLVGVYQNHPEHTGYRFEFDRENVVLFFSRYCAVFVDTFRALLDSEISIGRGVVVPVFSSRIFDAELTRLRLAGEKLGRLAKQFATFSLNRFNALKEFQDEATSYENSAMLDLSYVSDTLTQLGMSLADMLRKRSQVLRPAGQGPATNPIPAETETITSPPILNGKTILEALVLATNNCLLGGLMLDNNLLNAKFKREASVRHRLSELIATLGRLVTQEELAELIGPHRWLLEGD